MLIYNVFTFHILANTGGHFGPLSIIRVTIEILESKFQGKLFCIKHMFIKQDEKENIFIQGIDYLKHMLSRLYIWEWNVYTLVKTLTDSLQQ